MKKNKLFNYLFSRVLSVVILTTLWSCEKNSLDIIETINEKASIITFNEIPTNVLNTIPELNPNLGYQKRRSEEKLIINQNQIIKMVDSLAGNNFSIKFTLLNTPKNVLYNLILGANEDGSVKEPYIIKYIIYNIDEIEREDGIKDFSKMKASIEIYNYYKFLQNISTNYQNRTSNDPCNNSPYDGSGGGNDDNDDSSSNGGSGGGGGGGGVDCNASIWSSNGSIFAISIACDDGTSYSLRSSDNGCGNSGGGGTNGDTGINDGGNSSSDCPSGNIVNGECIPSNDDGVCGEGYVLDELDNCVIEAVVEQPEDNISDMEEFLKCFNLVDSATLTIYADQPYSNSAVAVSATGNVGHAYVSITQGGNTVTFGFYPKSKLKGSVNSIGVVGNNQNNEYDVSYTTQLSSSELNDILNYAKVTPSSYSLSFYNCTDYAIIIGNKAGLNIPDCYGVFGPYGLGGSTPAKLGQYLRSKVLETGDSKKVTKGVSPSESKTCN